MNTGQTVSKIGYFGPNSEYLYCSTNVQTLSIWNPQEVFFICFFYEFFKK